MILRCLGWSLFALIMGFLLGGSVFWGLYGPNTIERANGTYEKQFSPSSMIAQLNENWGLAVSGAICAGTLLILIVLVVLIWQGCLRRRISPNLYLFRGRISLDLFRCFRKSLALFAASYAIYCAGRLLANYVSDTKGLAPEFVPELIAISVFWVLAPPIWFFVEYFAVASDCIDGLPGTEENLKPIKNYADYASKIWAGVLALLGLIALKH